MKDDEEAQWEKRKTSLMDFYGFSFEQAELLASLFVGIESRDAELQKELKKIKKQLKVCGEGKT